MTPKQLAILNSLVTFAAEHIPGGLSVDERPVAKIVANWALEGKISEEPIASRVWATPVFVGKNLITDEKIVIYREIDDTHTFHIRLPDGSIQQLSPGPYIKSWTDPLSGYYHVQIESPEWSGQAVGTRNDILAEEALRR
jgi:hypothetical protein